MNRHIKKISVFLFLFSICFSLLVSPPGVGVAEASEAVAYRLKWLFNASVIGDIYADVHGHFKAQGLDVTVKEGGPERDAIRELELGYAAFGVASADQVIRARSKGSPVVVLAQLFQVNAVIENGGVGSRMFFCFSLLQITYVQLCKNDLAEVGCP